MVQNATDDGWEGEGGGDERGPEEDEDESEDDDDEVPPSNMFQLQRTRCTAYPFRAANASVTALGAGEQFVNGVE